MCRMHALSRADSRATRRLSDVRVARALRTLRAGGVATLPADDPELSDALEARLRETGVEFGIECDGTGRLHYVPIGVSS
jgi:hypothetical protein